MSAIQPPEADLIRQYNDRTSERVLIRFLKTDDPRSKDLQSFVDALTVLASQITVQTEISERHGPPALLLGKALRYHAIPTQNELSPFLDIVYGRNQVDLDMNASVRERIQAVEMPAHLKLYTTPQCIYCPQAVRLIASFALVNPLLQVAVIDGILFPELSATDAILSVPTLILDDRFRWTGAMKVEEILEGLVHRDPSMLSAQSMESILKEGNARRLAEMILGHGSIFPAFPDLLKHPEWSVRLGAMVVIEEIADADPVLASHVLEPLWKAFEDLEAPVKGDVIYLIGLLGSREWVPRLESLFQTQEREELREVLEEALETLRHPGKDPKSSS